MSLVSHVHDRLNSLGLPCTLNGNQINVVKKEINRSLTIVFDDDNWDEEFEKYKKARSIDFHKETRILTFNNTVEKQLIRLNAQSLLLKEDYQLTDQSGNSVVISRASKMFAFSFFDSEEYEKYFEKLKNRFFNSALRNRRFRTLLYMPITATYNHKGRKRPDQLTEIAEVSIRKSLFKIAVENHECLTLWQARKSRQPIIDEVNSNTSIPRAVYDDNVVSYYKVAKASPFPSQSFLAYYHVLEYFFLRVSELLLHARLASVINSTNFLANNAGLDKVISMVRGQDAKSDETEMLKNVLEHYVNESELIDFIQDFEKKCGEKLYTNRNKIFGEDLQISLKLGHARGNAAKVLKHVRNAIVHSSDRYKREECHIPLSETEDIIGGFIPLIRFLAERVIFGTAK